MTSATQVPNSATRFNSQLSIVGSTRHGSSSHIKPLPLLDTFQCNLKCQRLEHKPKTESHDDFDLLFPPPSPCICDAPRRKSEQMDRAKDDAAHIKASSQVNVQLRPLTEPANLHEATDPSGQLCQSRHPVHW
ncbi:uncharacterized protein APUU_50730S [Aspergillus puulaauensis]|uniref:Uncharacterized protein n=1 Tax=Aspergillus puulaauensis TaxID=1220207 RepID=A0A7R8ANJ2_9EURO|nr:uncharacterized protein APUU_50730S [Aspergillus puulaauensis]BCS26019.1 hypothetical protein APUU_50730S [Aspergillus puulaauensis]